MMLSEPPVPSTRRWAISLADLALLIACTLLLGWRPDAGRAPSDRRGVIEHRIAAEALFIVDEAQLSIAGERRLRAILRPMPAVARVQVSIGYGAGGSQRLDAWELAAARTAMIGRRFGTMRPMILAAPQPDSTQVLITGE
jgi:hypothetical protein